MAVQYYRQLMTRAIINSFATHVHACMLEPRRRKRFHRIDFQRTRLATRDDHLPLASSRVMRGEEKPRLNRPIATAERTSMIIQRSWRSMVAHLFSKPSSVLPVSLSLSAFPIALASPSLSLMRASSFLLFRSISQRFLLVRRVKARLGC